MRFLSNFGCNIIFVCSNNFWHQQNSNSLFKGSIGHVTSQCKWPIPNQKQNTSTLNSHIIILRHFQGVMQLAAWMTALIPKFEGPHIYRKLFSLNFEIGSHFLKSCVYILFSKARLQNPHEQFFSFFLLRSFFTCSVR